jgi:hypothetical protein
MKAVLFALFLGLHLGMLIPAIIFRLRWSIALNSCLAVMNAAWLMEEMRWI